MPDIINVLVLGSGAVAGPCVDYLLRNPKNKLTIASRTLSTSERLAARRPNTTAISLDASNLAELSREVAAHDLVISLLPFSHHADVIRAAIEGKTNVVTTSYVSPAMRELEDAARAAGIVVLNEVGVDPGVDHLYAIKMISEVHAKGGKIREFHSYCGGLPAPECSDNPLRFKFSWSPRGALLSQYNSASFLRDGVVQHIPRDRVMAEAKPYHIVDGYSFVAYPNRDSTPFREFYGIPEAKTVVRGSLRYEGNPSFVAALIKLGWLDVEPKEWLTQGLTWAEIQARMIDAPGTDEGVLVRRIEEICEFENKSERDRIIAGLQWIGVFSNQSPQLRGTLLDTLCGRLDKSMSFQPGERDLVMLQHKFVVDWAGGSTETFTSTLELLGDRNGYSAMSKSVGITCGIATQLLLDGHPEFTRPGVWAPYTPELCTPIREALVGEGIELVEVKVA